MQHVSVLMKPASSLCNMKCEYCFYSDEVANRKRNSFGMMSEETLKSIIEKSLSDADETASYVFQGGEPTLRGIEFYKLAVEIQKRYNKSNVLIYNALQTNGLLLDEEWCQFLTAKKKKFMRQFSVK